MRRFILLPVAALAFASACSDTGNSLVAPGESPRFHEGTEQAISGQQLPGTSTVRLTWHRVDGASDYQIQIGNASGNVVANNNVTATAITGSTHVYADFANIPSGTYTARVKAHGNAQQNNWVESASFTVASAVVAAVDQAVTISFTGGLSNTYNAQPQGVTFSTSHPVQTTVTYNGSTTVPTDAGTYQVVVTVNQSGYTGTAATSMVIDPAPLSVNLGSGSIVLGNSLPCIVSGYTGWQGSDTQSLITGTVGCSTSSTPSTQSGAGAYTLGYSGGLSAGANYTVSAGTSGTVTATYLGNGFLRPILANGSRTEFRAGSKIPLKFTLRSASASVGNATATLTVNGAIIPAVFRYDATDQQYIFNFDTLSSDAGKTLSIVATADDGVTVFSATVNLTGR